MTNRMDCALWTTRCQLLFASGGMVLEPDHVGTNENIMGIRCHK